MECPWYVSPFDQYSTLTSASILYTEKIYYHKFSWHLYFEQPHQWISNVIYWYQLIFFLKSLCKFFVTRYFIGCCTFRNEIKASKQFFYIILKITIFFSLYERLNIFAFKWCICFVIKIISMSSSDILELWYLSFY